MVKGPAESDHRGFGDNGLVEVEEGGFTVSPYTAGTNGSMPWLSAFLIPLRAEHPRSFGCQGRRSPPGLSAVTSPVAAAPPFRLGRRVRGLHLALSRSTRRPAARPLPLVRPLRTSPGSDSANAPPCLTGCPVPAVLGPRAPSVRAPGSRHRRPRRPGTPVPIVLADGLWRRSSRISSSAHCALESNTTSSPTSNGESDLGYHDVAVAHQSHDSCTAGEGWTDPNSVPDHRRVGGPGLLP